MKKHKQNAAYRTWKYPPKLKHPGSRNKPIKPAVNAPNAAPNPQTETPKSVTSTFSTIEGGQPISLPSVPSDPSVPSSDASQRAQLLRASNSSSSSLPPFPSVQTPVPADKPCALADLSGPELMEILKLCQEFTLEQVQKFIARPRTEKFGFNCKTSTSTLCRFAQHHDPLNWKHTISRDRGQILDYYFITNGAAPCRGIVASYEQRLQQLFNAGAAMETINHCMRLWIKSNKTMMERETWHEENLETHKNVLTRIVKFRNGEYYDDSEEDQNIPVVGSSPHANACDDAQISSPPSVGSCCVATQDSSSPSPSVQSVPSDPSVPSTEESPEPLDLATINKALADLLAQHPELQDTEIFQKFQSKTPEIAQIAQKNLVQNEAALQAA